MPETRYVEVSAAHAGYQVIGSGPVDLVFVPNWLHHLDIQGIEGRWRLFAANP